MKEEWLLQITETNDFVSMSTDFKKFLIAGLPKNIKLVKFMKGYFYISGFVKNTDTGRYAYFSTDDMRFNGSWSENILFRDAINDEDFYGGRNRYCEVNDLIKSLIKVTE